MLMRGKAWCIHQACGYVQAQTSAPTSVVLQGKSAMPQRRASEKRGDDALGIDLKRRLHWSDALEIIDLTGMVIACCHAPAEAVELVGRHRRVGVFGNGGAFFNAAKKLASVSRGMRPLKPDIERSGLAGWSYGVWNRKANRCNEPSRGA